MRNIITITVLKLLLVAFVSVNAQVKTNLNNPNKLTSKGMFNTNYKAVVDFEAKRIKFCHAKITALNIARKMGLAGCVL